MKQRAELDIATDSYFLQDNDPKYKEDIVNLWILYQTAKQLQNFTRITKRKIHTHNYLKGYAHQVPMGPHRFERNLKACLLHATTLNENLKTLGISDFLLIFKNSQEEQLCSIMYAVRRLFLMDFLSTCMIGFVYMLLSAI